MAVDVSVIGGNRVQRRLHRGVQEVPCHHQAGDDPEYEQPFPPAMRRSPRGRSRRGTGCRQRLGRLSSCFRDRLRKPHHECLPCGCSPLGLPDITLRLLLCQSALYLVRCGAIDRRRCAARAVGSRDQCFRRPVAAPAVVVKEHEPSRDRFLFGPAGGILGMARPSRCRGGARDRVPIFAPSLLVATDVLRDNHTRRRPLWPPRRGHGIRRENGHPPTRPANNDRDRRT